MSCIFSSQSQSEEEHHSHKLKIRVDQEHIPVGFEEEDKHSRYNSLCFLSQG